MKYTHYQSRFSSKDKGVQHLVGEWSDIVDMVMKVDQWHTFNAKDKESYENAKKFFDAIVMAEMKPNQPRKADNVVSFYAIVLDVDDGATYEDVREDLKDYEYVMYSSGSTGLKSGDRFRVILPLNTPMNANDWKNYNTSLSERFPYSDECFKKGIQIQYLPVINTAFADSFKQYHNVGKWFDYQDTKDLPYVESLSLDVITKRVVFDSADFTDDEFRELGEAIVSHQANSLGYEDRRLLAQRLKHIGMNDYDNVMILDAVSAPGYSKPNAELVRIANPNYARPEGLYKHVAKGVRIPALERRIVKDVVRDSEIEELPEELYDGEYFLNHGEYLSQTYEQMDFSEGVNLLISDVNTGKSTQFMGDDGTKDGYMFLAPLTSIVKSFKGDNKISGSGIATWNQIETIIKEKDKNKFSDTTLVVDECHGLFEDYGYKSKLINRLIDSFSHFKSVILMSGTVEADYYSSIQFNKVYRVHKPSLAKKNIRTIFSTKKDDLVIEHINALTNKTIVLMNNKDLIEVVRGRLNRKCLVITADKKNDPEVIQFFETGDISGYDVVIGTNSIVEGLSITTELDNVDVVVWGDVVPERIEQFSNRFRNVTTEKNVWFFIDRQPVDLLDDYDRMDVLADAKELTDSLGCLYEGIRTDVLKRSFLRQFSGDMSKDLVYYHEGSFKISFTGIDYDYALHRGKLYRNDFSLFAQKMMVFGFNVFAPIIADGDAAENDNIKEEKSIITETRKNARKSELAGLKDDIEANTIVDEKHASELYTATYSSVQKLLAKGVDKADVPKLIDGYVEDEKFFAKAHEDADFISTGESVRELVITLVDKKTELQAGEILDIANAVVGKVLNEYFAGDQKQMVKSRSWGSLVSNGNTYGSNDLNILDRYVLPLASKNGKAAKIILQKYILLGKSKVKSIKGVKVRVAPVEALSLTGLSFRKFDFSNMVNGSIESLKKKFTKTEKTFAEKIQDAHEVTKDLTPYERGALSRLISSQGTTTEDDRATYIACRKFSLFKTKTVEEIIGIVDAEVVELQKKYSSAA